MYFLEFLAVGAWGFWLLLAVAALIISEAIDSSKYGLATLTVAAVVAILAFFGNVNIVSWINDHPYDVVKYVAGYLAVGVLWAVTKWYLWLKKIRRVIDAFKEQDPTASKSQIETMLYRRGYGTNIPPKVGDYKAKIIGWMSFWPGSLVWTMINDPVRRIFETIYYRIAKFMQRISDNVFADIANPRD